MKATLFDLEFDESEFDGSEVESENDVELDPLEDDELVHTDMDQFSFENIDTDYYSIGYVDPSDFEY